MEIKYSALEQSWSVVFSKEDLLDFANLFRWRKKDVYLDYSLTKVEKFYGESKIHWVEKETRRGIIRAPYHIVFDYRDFSSKEWGFVKFSGKYEFPKALVEHRERMVERFKKENRLKKGNNPAPRVSRFSLNSKGLPIFHVEKAYYFDQVGTNLTLDYHLPEPIQVNGRVCQTVREWDLAQANSDSLPPFEKSKLANTIGISIGVYAYTKNGEKVILKRRRHKKVAVYPNMWHVPFSFALAIDFSFEDNKLKTLKDFISLDLGHEFAEEIGLDFSDFSPIKPLAFCRDLTRGGKPQFFFAIESELYFEELKEKIQDRTNEFVDKLSIVEKTFLNKQKIPYSPELTAFLLLNM